MAEKEKIELSEIDPGKIADKPARNIIIYLLNLVEKLYAEIRAVNKDRQNLRDEVNRLKGEQGKPKINPQSKPTETDISSEKERHEPKKREGYGSKSQRVSINREEICTLDRSRLPEDAVSKGYEEVFIQDIVIKTENILFKREKYYSPSKKCTYLGELPAGYRGQYGPTLRALIPSLYFGANLSIPKLHTFLKYFTVQISRGQLSHMLIHGQEKFEEESSEVLETGLQTSTYQQIDETHTRVNGQSHYCQVITTGDYTAYRTTGGRDRLSTLSALQDHQPREYLLNEEALAYISKHDLRNIWQEKVALWPTQIVWTEEEFKPLMGELAKELGEMGKSEHCIALNEKVIREALALAAYHQQTKFKPPLILVTDDASQWQYLSPEQALCWVHEVRHYIKMHPANKQMQRILEKFIHCIWMYYRKLLDYKQAPDPSKAARLRVLFERLFSIKTKYEELNKRIAQTKQKQEQLLMVLKYPQIPLHNNAAELGARQRVRKRDVSFGPRTTQGMKAWDTFMTLAETTRKQDVNFYEYLRDRIVGGMKIPRLSDLIKAKEVALIVMSP